jgi:hypothetical protein
MIKLPNVLPNRLRTLSQALADLLAKYAEMQLNDPQRSDLAQMISVLAAEIACRSR